MSEGRAKREQLPDHEIRMEAARNRARWELGDGSHAAVIIAAYLNPQEDAENLAREEAE